MAYPNLADKTFRNRKTHFHLIGGVQRGNGGARLQICPHADVAQAHHTGERRFNAMVFQPHPGSLSLGFSHTHGGDQFIHLGLGHAIVGAQTLGPLQLPPGIGQLGFNHLEIGTGLTIVQT